MSMIARWTPKPGLEGGSYHALLQLRGRRPLDSSLNDAWHPFVSSSVTVSSFFRQPFSITIQQLDGVGYCCGTVDSF